MIPRALKKIRFTNLGLDIRQNLLSLFNITILNYRFKMLC